VHFSVAGFGAVAVAGLLHADGAPGARWAVAGLATGLPLTALGFVLDSALAAWPGTLVVAGSGLVLAVALARRNGDDIDRRDWVRPVRWAAATALGLGMVLAIGWSTAAVLGVTFLDIPTMERTHGMLNLVGLLGATAALARARSAIPTHRVPRTALVGAAVAIVIALVPAVAALAVEPDRNGPWVAAAALVGAAVAGWWLPGSRWRSRSTTNRVMALAFMAVLAGCVSVSTLIAVSASTPMGLATAVIVVPLLTALGMVVLGWAAMLAAIPCAVVWTWVMDGHLPGRVR
jgi:hypothetical protein